MSTLKEVALGCTRYSRSIPSVSGCAVFLTYFYVLVSQEDIALVSAKALYLGAAFIPVLFLHFVVEFFNDRPQYIVKKFLPVFYCFSLGFILLAFSGYLVARVEPKFGVNFFAVAGSGYKYFLLFFLVCVVWGLAKLWTGFFSSSGLRQNQIKYLLFGSLIGYIGGINNFLIPYDIVIYPLHPFGNYAIPLYVLITTYAIVQYRLLDINIFIRKSLIYASLLLMLLVPCYLVVILAQRLTFGSINYTFSTLTLLTLNSCWFLVSEVAL